MRFRSFQFSLAVLLLACGTVAAQTDPVSDSSPGPMPYGRGERPALQYSGSALPTNLFSLELLSETAYDSNVYNNNTFAVSDAVFNLGARLGYRRQAQDLSFGFEYQPYGVIYGQTGDRNALDHALQMDLSYNFGPRWNVRLREAAAYRTGLFGSPSRHEFVSEMDSPTRLNDGIFTPLARSLENNLRADANYQYGTRLSFGGFGGLLHRNYIEEPGESAGQDSREANAGMQVRYRMARRTTLGFLYMYQQMDFEQRSETGVHSGLLSVAWQPAPGLTLNVFGGPQRSHSRHRVQAAIVLFGQSFLLVGQTADDGWHPAFGGTVAWQDERTALQLGLRRTITDGGGLLPGSVTSTRVEFAGRRRLGRSWHAVFSAAEAYSTASGLSGKVDATTAGVGLERSLSERLITRFGYNLVRQRGASFLPLADVDRSRVSIGLHYRLAASGSGR